MTQERLRKEEKSKNFPDPNVVGGVSRYEEYIFSFHKVISENIDFRNIFRNYLRLVKIKEKAIDTISDTMSQMGMLDRDASNEGLLRNRA